MTTTKRPRSKNVELTREQYLTARRRWIAGERETLATDLGLLMPTLAGYAQRMGWPRRTFNRGSR